MGTTNFEKGATNVSASTTLGSYLAQDPTKVHSYFNDFNNYTAGDWTITTTEAGAGSATEAITVVDGGVLLLTNAAGDNDNDFLQLEGESFKFESGKKLWFKARFAVSDATQSDVVMGLQITDTSPLAVSDGVFFIKADASTALTFTVEKNGTETAATQTVTMSDDAYVTVGFYYDGVDNIELYSDDVKLQDVATTNLPDDEELTVSFGIQNGEAVAKTMSIDYIFVAKER